MEYRMSLLKVQDRIYVTVNDEAGTLIPTIVASIEPEQRRVPKPNGQPGFYYNQWGSGLQLAPDGVTVYPVDNINLHFTRPRVEVIPELDINPATGEVISNEVDIPDALLFHFQNAQATSAGNRANGGGTKPTIVANPVTEVTG